MIKHSFVRASPFSGKVNERFIMARPEDVAAFQDVNRPSIQACFPYMSAGDREFIMTGITPEEWEETFGDVCR